MKYKCKIVPINKNLLDEAVNNYKENQNQENLISLVEKICCFFVATYNLNPFDLKIEKTVGLGNFGKGILTINEKLFNKPQSLGYFINLLIAVYHELTHILVLKQNEKIYELKDFAKDFLPTYNDRGILHIFKKITQDEVIAKGIKEWLYLQNENELFAFKNSLNKTSLFLQEYFSTLTKYVPTFENYVKEKKDDALKKYPFIMGNENNIIDMINGYQITTISRGLNKLLNFEEKAVITTFSITFTYSVRQVLIQEILKVRDENYVVKYLCNPYFCPTIKERELLETVYSKEFLNNFMFKSQKNPTHNLSALK